MSRVFLDTNILAYTFDSASPSKQAAARAALASHRFSVWDAMVLEAAAESGCGELWTEDLTHGSVLRGVRVVNPLLSA